jgi:disulfide oxidoreductase YuzD
MRYILDISGYDLKLIRASIVNFQRSLELSEQLNNKIKRKWGGKK